MLRQTTSRIIRRAFHASRQARQAEDAGASGALKLTFALPHQAIMSDATVSFFFNFSSDRKRRHSLMSFFWCVEFQISDFYVHIYRLIS